MLYLSWISLHNAELKSTLLEGLPVEHTLVDSSILKNFQVYLKIFLSCMSLHNAKLESSFWRVSRGKHAGWQ